MTDRQIYQYTDKGGDVSQEIQGNRADAAISHRESPLPIATKSMFWRPSYLEPSAWHEHIPFAFWLIQNHRPRVLVELGTHYGVSYFAFCQAVARLEIDTACYAVDTWEGDEHAGHYNSQVYEQVNRYNRDFYSGFSTLIKSTFDDAVDYFQDGSVDLLHIDGLHTYEAVRHDYETWAPKLSKNAVVIFHDTNVRERNFGVSKFYAELTANHRHFEFTHGHGLGVVCHGNPGTYIEELVIAQEEPAKRQVIQEVFSHLGHACSSAFIANRSQEQLKDANARVNRAEEQNASASKQISSLSSKIKELTDDRDRAADREQRQIETNAQERGRLIQELAESDRANEALNQQIAAALQKSAHADTKLDAISSERDEIQRVYRNVLNEKRQMENNLRTLQLERQRSTQEIERLENECLQIRRKFEKLSSEYERVSDAHADAVRAIRVSKAEKQDAISTNNRILLERDGALRSKSRLQSELDSARAAKTQIQQQWSQTARELAQLNADLETSQRSNSRSEAENEKLAAIAAAAKTDQANAEAKAQQLAAEVQRSQTELNNARASTKHANETADQRATEIAKLVQLLESRRRKQQHLETLARDYQQRVQQLEASSSWRLTRPLRRLANPFSFLRKKRLRREQISFLSASGRFDNSWYLEKYSDVRDSKMNPIEHYVRHGAAEGRNPSPDFDTKFYLETYADVQTSGLDPFTHFLRHGEAEGRRTKN